MKKTFTFILALTLLTIVGASAQNNNGVSTNTNANANANVNATGSASSATAPGNPSVFGNGFWNVACYNGDIINQPSKAVYGGFYTENNLDFDSRTRWANTGVPSNANAASGNTYSGISPLDLKHSVSYKRTGIASGLYTLVVLNNDDNASLMINGIEVWKRGYSKAPQNAWTGYLNETSKLEFKWINVSLTSNAAFEFTPAIALPVSFTGLEAKKAEDSVQITWSTASEQNVNYFTIERTNDVAGQAIIEVAKVKANGNSSSVSTYNGVDNNPTKGASYYRIKSVDIDGTIQYSEFVTIVNNEFSAFTMEVYPNPTNSQNINIALNKVAEGTQISLIDATGNTVYTQTTSSDNFTVDTPHNILPGVYQVMATVNNETISKRLIIQ